MCILTTARCLTGTVKMSTAGQQVDRISLHGAAGHMKSVCRYLSTSDFDSDGALLGGRTIGTGTGAEFLVLYIVPHEFYSINLTSTPLRITLPSQRTDCAHTSSLSPAGITSTTPKLNFRSQQLQED
jgi:hypothetical protein